MGERGSHGKHWIYHRLCGICDILHRSVNRLRHRLYGRKRSIRYVCKSEYRWGGYVVKTGSYNNSANPSFDCGLDDPDAVIVFANRQEDDWTWVYFKAGAFDNFNYSSNPRVVGNQTEIYADVLSVNGSIVSATNARWGNLWWVAIKKI